MKQIDVESMPVAMPEGVDYSEYLVATYLVSFPKSVPVPMLAPALAIEQSTGTWLAVPGETEEDIEQTLDLMRRVRFSYAFMYHFNARDGTPAARMPNRTPDKVKKQRLARVIALQKEITSSLMKERVGQTDEVLIEDISRRSSREVLARTTRDEMGVFAAPQNRIGQFARVRLLSIAGNTFRGEEV